MLSTATKLGRCKLLPQRTLIIINNHDYEHSSQQSSFRGYVVKHPGNQYSNKVHRFYHGTVAQYSSKENHIKLSPPELDVAQYEKIANDTLESLTEYFDELVEAGEHLNEADVTYGDGVLTIKLGNKYGTYVINRQTPNKQIWLSSPTSGPKRYDFIDGAWIYKHDGRSLHELLDNELPSIVKNATSFSKCAYSRNIQIKVD